MGLLVDYSLIRLYGVLVRKYKRIFKTNCIINSKVTALCSNRSAVLTYIYVFTHKSSCQLKGRVKMTDTRTHSHPILIPSLVCLQKYTHRGMLIFLTYRSVSHTRMQLCTQLSLLFHRCVMSLLGKDGRIADCTVGHRVVFYLHLKLKISILKLLSML